MIFTKFQVKGHLKVKCQGHKVIVLLYRYLTVHGFDLYPGHLTLRWSWPWPLNGLHKIPGQRSKVTSRSNVEVTRSSYYKVTRSLYYSRDILLFLLALTFTLDIWPWDYPDLDFKWPSQNPRSKVKGHLEVKWWGDMVIILQCQKVIVLQYRYLTVHGLDLYSGHLTLRWSWPWPLNDLHKNSRSKIKGHLKVKCRGQKVIILQGHKVII